MNILVLGASSSIGRSIVKCFAKENRLFLLSTKLNKLVSLKKEALDLGSQQVEIIEVDLQLPINIFEIIPTRIDMIINAACASSRLKNNNIEPHSHQKYTNIDLSGPIVLLEHFLKENSKQGKYKKLHYIFINTILTKINSPNYSIYYSYKILQQEYINRFKKKYNNILFPLNVVVGSQIDRTKESPKTVKLAKKIQEAVINNKSEFIFGFEGKIIYMLYRVSPLISNGFIYMKRLLVRK